MFDLVADMTACAITTLVPRAAALAGVGDEACGQRLVPAIVRGDNETLEEPAMPIAAVPPSARTD